MITAGVDVGSLSIKAVLLADREEVLGYSILPTQPGIRELAEVAFNQALENSHLSKDDVAYIVSTGYGRRLVPFSHGEVTEITCHGKGAYWLHPEVRTIIDIGGQDSKAIRVDSKGLVTNFVMNDKCAAGTGRFLEVMAHALGVKLEKMGTFSLQAKKALDVSNTCTVFAESEVISLIAGGNSKEDIVAGLHLAIAKRTVGMVERIGIVEKVAMTGGVAKNIGVVQAIESLLGVTLFIPEEPQIVGALGAAIVAVERYQDSLEAARKA